MDAVYEQVPLDAFEELDGATQQALRTQAYEGSTENTRAQLDTGANGLLIPGSDAIWNSVLRSYFKRQQKCRKGNFETTAEADRWFTKSGEIWGDFKAKDNGLWQRYEHARANLEQAKSKVDELKRAKSPKV